MYLTIKGVRVEVEVSDTGMFYDKPFMKQHSRTLKGLEKKLNQGNNPAITSPIIVEHTETLRQGRVVGKGSAKWSKSYKVRWNDTGKTSVICESSLRKPMTPDQREQLKALEVAFNTADDIRDNAFLAFDEMDTEFSVNSELRVAFPR